MLYTPSLIQTILSVPGSHRFVQPQGAACRLYCRWGITPRLEDKYSFVHWDIVYTCMGEIASTFLDENLYKFSKFYKKDFTKSKSCSIIKKKGAMDVRARQVSCSFTGHRPEKLPWGDRESDRRCRALQERLFQAVQTAYEQGFRHFLCGMARGCDFWFCEAVLRLRGEHGEVSLEAAIPYAGQAERWDRPDRARYEALLARCDYKTVLQEAYSPGCMQRRNRYLVDHASMLIAVHDGLPGGTQQTIAYALRRGLDIVDTPSVLEKNKDGV